MLFCKDIPSYFKGQLNKKVIGHQENKGNNWENTGESLGKYLSSKIRKKSPATLKQDIKCK